MPPTVCRTFMNSGALYFVPGTYPPLEWVESLAFSAGCDDRHAIVIDQLPSSTAPRSAARSVRHLLECLNVVRRQ